jgi:hypothetical protein
MEGAAILSGIFIKLFHIEVGILNSQVLGIVAPPPHQN